MMAHGILSDVANGIHSTQHTKWRKRDGASSKWVYLFNIFWCCLRRNQSARIMIHIIIWFLLFIQPIWKRFLYFSEILFLFGRYLNNIRYHRCTFEIRRRQPAHFKMNPHLLSYSMHVFLAILLIFHRRYFYLCTSILTVSLTFIWLCGWCCVAVTAVAAMEPIRWRHIVCIVR